MGAKSKYNFRDVLEPDAVGILIRVSKVNILEADDEVDRIRIAASMWSKRNDKRLFVNIVRKELGGRVQIVAVTV